MSRRTIVFVNPMLTTAGNIRLYNVQMLNIAKSVQPWYNSALITSSHQDSSLCQTIETGILLFSVKSVRIPFAYQMFRPVGELILNLGSALSTFEPDVIVTAEDMSLGTLIASRYAQRVDIPLVVYHGPTTHYGFPNGIPHLIYSKTAGQRIYRKATRFVAKTQDARRFLRRLGIPSEKIHLIPPGIDTSQFDVSTTENHLVNGLDLSEKDIVLFCGRMSKQKKPDVALDAFARLTSEYPRLHLIFVTQGDTLLGGIKKDIKAKGLQSRVSILQNIPNSEMPALYSAARVTVSSSEIEIFGMTTIESIACGTPVVATPTSGSRQIIAQGENGLLSKGFSSKDLSERISDLLEHPMLTPERGEEIRQTIIGKYDLKGLGEA